MAAVIDPVGLLVNLSRLGRGGRRACWRRGPWSHSRYTERWSRRGRKEWPEPIYMNRRTWTPSSSSFPVHQPFPPLAPSLSHYSSTVIVLMPLTRTDNISNWEIKEIRRMGLSSCGGGGGEEEI